jgi:soluble lytic murein transglycosylase-like protein
MIGTVPMRFSALLILLSIASTAAAAEYAVLANGGRLRADRHESVDGKLRLYMGDGYVEMDAALIRGFEPIEDGPAAPVEPIAAPASVKPAGPSPAELADAAADKYGLPRSLVRSVMSAESANRRDALSSKGAIGLMQLMPGTAKDLGVDPNDPAQNVDGGARYLRDMLLRYDGGLWRALAAYNAGPGAVEKYHGVPPYRETINYVKRIDKAYQKTARPDAAPVTGANN